MRNETSTTNRKVKKQTGRYGILAACMLVFLFGGFLLIEHMVLVHLTAAVLFCIVSGGMLLYALMKMNVMEFQPGSFWYRLNLYLNQEKKAVPNSRRAARSTVYAMIADGK